MFSFFTKIFIVILVFLCKNNPFEKKYIHDNDKCATKRMKILITFVSVQILSPALNNGLR